MKNMIEYVASMSTSFATEDLNEADALVFSQLAYLNYDTRTTCFSEITTAEMIQSMVKHTWNADKNALLLETIIQSGRFKEVKILRPVTILDAVAEQQFSAVTFQLAEDRYCIAFRGTNSTFAGWKENFNMTYLETLPSQLSALAYFAKSQHELPGTYTLVGHSKGGNLATYVGVHAPKEDQAAILNVYNFDGPGLQTVDSDTVLTDKIKKLVPTASVVGILFEQEQHFMIARSSNSGIWQHDLFSWEIADDQQIAVDTELSWLSLFTHQVITELLASLDKATKQQFLDSLYAIAIQLGSPYLAEGLRPDLKHAETIFGGLKNASKEEHRIWRLVIKLLATIIVREGMANGKRKVSAGNRVK